MKEIPNMADTLELSASTETRRSADSSEKAYQAIRQMLVEFILKPEERLNEVQLSRHLGVSRTPIREALNRLASEGFVSTVPNRGFFVRSLNIEGLLGLYELRSIVECAAFKLMCQRADNTQLLRLKTYWDSQVEGYQDLPPDAILSIDEGFHLLIAELSGNPEIVNTLESINARIRFIRRIQIEHATHDMKLISAHSNIVAAAMERDIDNGINILHKHIEITVSATREALKDALLKSYSKPKGIL